MPTAQYRLTSHMQAFSSLYSALDETNRTAEKVEILRAYFAQTPPEDAAWALYFLIGNRVGRAISSTSLRQWGAEASGIPLWLVEESYHVVGDLAETLALLLPEPEVDGHTPPLHRLVQDVIAPLSTVDEATRRAMVEQAWRELDARQRYVFHKLITGGFRVGVGRTLVQRALAQVADIPPAIMAHRLMGQWNPGREDFLQLLSPVTEVRDPSQPYPFFLANPLEESPTALGPRSDWTVEWKWDGIRSQVIHRSGTVLVWTRGEELVTDVYPEIAAVGAALPDGTVIDGEILAWDAGHPLPFQVLQQRLGRKKVDDKLLASAPVSLVAYDLLEANGDDVRAQPLSERRAQLEALVGSLPPGLSVSLSPLVDAATWDEATRLRTESRDRMAEGFMLKRRSSSYGVGRTKGDWWKWKIDPYSVDAVLVYAQPGHGRRANLFTDYTFAVWHQGELVPCAKAYSGLTDEEIRQVDAFVRRNTLEKFGPVRSVKPSLVFELAFEGIQPSTRHKSGLALRFPRMARWRRDKLPEEADSLDTLQALLNPVGPRP
jgi:DNA ligase 1